MSLTLGDAGAELAGFAAFSSFSSVSGAAGSAELRLRVRGRLSRRDEVIHVEQHDVQRWQAPADGVDHAVLSACGGPVIDIGCGPGRLTLALAERGVQALGVDACPVAVAVARSRGAAVIQRDVFDPLPGEGRWECVVLADGNIGIGGNPPRLLRRLRRLVTDAGSALVEVSPRDVDHRGVARLHRSGQGLGDDFPWAVVGAAAVISASRGRGWAPGAVLSHGARRFVTLHAARRRRPW